MTGELVMKSQASGEKDHPQAKIPANLFSGDSDKEAASLDFKSLRTGMGLRRHLVESCCSTGASSTRARAAHKKNNRGVSKFGTKYIPSATNTVQIV